MPGMSGPDLQRGVGVITGVNRYPSFSSTASEDQNVWLRPPASWGRRVPVQAVQRGGSTRRNPCRASERGPVADHSSSATLRDLYYARATIRIRSRPLPCPASRPSSTLSTTTSRFANHLELLIKNEGWQPQLFASADDFLEHPRALAPSCLVLDTDATRAATVLSCSSSLPTAYEIPIISVLTDDGDVPTTVRAMKAGAVEFLTKPFAADDLLQAMRAALAHSRVALDLRC